MSRPLLAASAFLGLVIALAGTAPAAAVQDPGKELSARIEALVAGAYQTATRGLPCRIKTRGKPKMLRWEEVDRCLNEAAGRVDWAAVGQELQSLRAAARGLSTPDFASSVESALSAHAVAYDRVFVVKDPETLLPLTNSLLKFLPADSLQNVPVIDKVGIRVGTFLGPYSFERMGGLSAANPYRLSLFQYTDASGNPQSVSEKLLLDSFGVPWKEAAGQRGFRLTADKLELSGRR